MVRTLLTTVDDTFEVQGRLVLVPGVGPGGPSFRHGQTVELVRPDGSKLLSKAWIELPTPNPGGVYPLGLPGLAKHEAPKGTEVWLIEDGS